MCYQFFIMYVYMHIPYKETESQDRTAHKSVENSTLLIHSLVLPAISWSQYVRIL